MLHGRNVVVTGGANGLGKALAERLTQRGAGVAIVDADVDGGERVAAALRTAGGTAVAIAGDISRRGDAHDLFRRAVDALGLVHGLANVAGVYPRRPLLEITDEDWDFSFGVNVRGLYHMSTAAIEHMRPHGWGRIVNISSIDAFIGHPKNAHYAAMKAGVVSLTKTFGKAFAGDGILVNGVAPGAIATEKAKASGFLGESANVTPIGRAAEPEDIADVVIFLLSDQNRYMVGETVIVNGGYLIP
jgi:NAD(P)-dependent dehydrogenase (short-subunit alcohol dehydrogenase family)